MNEWWYVVGHVRSGARTFGYETTIFKFDHVRPPGFPTPVTIYRTDVAITDEYAKRFIQRVNYFFPDAVSLRAESLNVRVGKASLVGSTPRAMDLRSSLPGGSLQMHLSSRRAPMYVGGRGYIPFGDGFTYYYSLTDLATFGSLHLGGKTYRVTGTSWLDHQWGQWSWSTIRGWTWMALQLNNGVQLSLFDVRSTHRRVGAASVLRANGKLSTLTGTTISPTGSWHSPHTGGVYPSGWVVRIPAAHSVLRISPTVKDQELAVPGQSRGSYWEGSGRVSGSWEGKGISGLTYTELTGYAGSGGRG